MTEVKTVKELLDTVPQVGRVEWIGIRLSRGEPVRSVEQVRIEVGTGLEGDRFAGKTKSKRQVTLVQHEHLDVMATLLGRESVSPALLRRNIAVSGINLLSLKDQRFRLGEVLLEFTGLCPPCGKMERNLGEGGFQAMRGHGGITARVCEPGLVRLHDAVTHAGPAESD